MATMTIRRPPIQRAKRACPASEPAILTAVKAMAAAAA
jgi:hypothetical protein